MLKGRLIFKSSTSLCNFYSLLHYFIVIAPPLLHHYSNLRHYSDHNSPFPPTIFSPLPLPLYRETSQVLQGVRHGARCCRHEGTPTSQNVIELQRPFAPSATLLPLFTPLIRFSSALRLPFYFLLFSPFLLLYFLLRCQCSLIVVASYRPLRLLSISHLLLF
jgi:hypothetical protein